MTKTLVQQYEETKAAYHRALDKRGPRAAITIRLYYKQRDLMTRCLADWNRKAA